LPTSPTLLSRYSRRRASRSRPSTARGPTRAILAPTLHTSPCERSACQIPSHQPSRMPPKNSVPSYLKKATTPAATPDRIVGYFGLWIYGRNVVCFARWKGRLQACHKTTARSAFIDALSAGEGCAAFLATCTRIPAHFRWHASFL